MSKAVVFMFPGQSSRYPGMLQKIVETYPAGAALLERCSDLLGRDLLGHYRADNEAIFATNRDIQVGVFLANHLHLRMLEDAGVTSEWSIGLSLGEYNHLVHIGALDLEAALELVDARGRLYDSGDGGLMVSLYPIDSWMVEQAIADLRLSDLVAVGLYNSPKQQVLSGARAAVEQVLAAIDEQVYVQATTIEHKLPMHAPVFETVGNKLRRVLADISFRVPRRPYVPNVLGEVLERASPAEIRECLSLHAYQAVRWQRSVEALAARLDSPCFVEVGPKAVLCNLFGRGWAPGRGICTDAAEDWCGHLHTLTAELAHAA